MNQAGEKAAPGGLPVIFWGGLTGGVFHYCLCNGLSQMAREKWVDFSHPTLNSHQSIHMDAIFSEARTK